MRFHKKSRGVPSAPKIDMGGLKDEECRTNSANVRLFMLEYGQGRSFAMQISSQTASRTLQGKFPVQMPRKKNQEKRLKRKMRRQLQQDRDNEWMSRAKEFEKTREEKNTHNAYTLLK